MKPTIHVAILGATGYGAGELLRLLTAHPHARVVSLLTRSQGGAQVGDLHPHLRGFYDLRLSTELDRAKLLDADYAVVFSALPHGESGPAIERLLSDFAGTMDQERLRVVDLSGDLRLRDARAHARYYPESPLLPVLRERFVYGLPELSREVIAGARWASGPGCLASAAILSGAPLLGGRPGCAPLVRDFRGPVVVDAKTGSSGSGRALKDTTHHPTRHADFRAYKPLAHQHEGEILQAWGDPHAERLGLSFVAQSMDTARGIFATLHMTLPEPQDASALRAAYTDFYRECPFVRVVDGSPTLQDVVGSNFCDISVAARGRQVIVLCALDNLVKGMAGTAIQNMNLMTGLRETTGLWTPALRLI